MRKIKFGVEEIDREIITDILGNIVEIKPRFAIYKEVRHLWFFKKKEYIDVIFNADDYGNNYVYYYPDTFFAKKFKKEEEANKLAEDIMNNPHRYCVKL